VTVSVVIAVYNGAWCIERAIESLLSQTVRPDEIFVCDDGSTDGTADLVADKFGSAVRVLRLPHRNSPSARRAGLDLATGDWLAFMDADDVWTSRKLEVQLAYLRRHPDVKHISSDGSLVSASGVVRTSWLSDYFQPVREMRGDLLPTLAERCYILMSSVMVARDVYHACGGIDRDIVYSHDYELWLKILANHPGAVLADPLIHYFTSPHALSRNYEGRDRDDLELMRRMECGEFRCDAVLQRRAGERAAALEYRLGVRAIKNGRIDEGRRRLRNASLDGPVGRRLVALAGSFVPAWAVGGLRRATWLKPTVVAPSSATLLDGSAHAHDGRFAASPVNGDQP